MRLNLKVHNFALVYHAILYGKSRRNHFSAGAVMMEFAARQWQYSDRQTVKLLIDDAWMIAKRLTEIGVHIIESYAAVSLYRMLNQQLYRTVAQQPDAYIHQEQIIAHQFP